MFQAARKQPILAIAERLGLRVLGKFINCPHHENDDGIDSNPSCSLNPKTDHFLCFSCGNSGSSIDLVCQVMNLAPKQPAEWLVGQGELPTHPAVGASFIRHEQITAILEDLLEACGDPSAKAMV